MRRHNQLAPDKCSFYIQVGGGGGGFHEPVRWALIRSTPPVCPSYVFYSPIHSSQTSFHPPPCVGPDPQRCRHLLPALATNRGAAGSTQLLCRPGPPLQVRTAHVFRYTSGFCPSPYGSSQLCAWDLTSPPWLSESTTCSCITPTSRLFEMYDLAMDFDLNAVGDLVRDDGGAGGGGRGRRGGGVQGSGWGGGRGAQASMGEEGSRPATLVPYPSRYFCLGARYGRGMPRICALRRRQPRG